MTVSITLIINSILLGIGLAMDAFSVSMANGLNQPNMSKRKTIFVSGVFAAFQAIMPLFGWICVHTLLNYFNVFEKFIPWIALILLSYIGGKMLHDGICGNEDENSKNLGIVTIIIQGIATSIDALSVGFTISEYALGEAVLCAALIAAVTFMLCIIGVVIGKKFGTKLSGKATILGGIILIGIGIEIFISSLL